MESLHEDTILTFHPDTLKAVRKEYDLDKPGAMDRAIDILELWIKKQDHFLKKNFSRAYLERSIIRAKGSVERTKERLDKLCTARSRFPLYYVVKNVKEFVELDTKAFDALCPKLTSDNYRVFVIRIESQEVTAQLFVEYYIRGFYFMEYFSAYDYANGLKIIFDYRNLNILEFTKHLDLVETTRLINVALNAYGLRINQIHVISTSKFVHLLVSTFKQIISAKLASRIQIHNDPETLLNYIDKDILPEECGGTGISIKELHKKWVEVLSTDDFLDYIKETYEAKIDEKLRPLKQLNDDYLGMPGTFRALSVD